MGSSAVDRHQAEVQRGGKEGQHQSAQIKYQEVVAQHHAVEQCIGKEGGSCTAHRHILHAGAEHIHQHQLCDGEHQIQRVDNVQQRGSGCNERRGKGDEQAYRHPAVGAVHIVSRGHGRLRVSSIVTIVIVIHMGLLQSLSAGTLFPCSGLRNIVYCIEMNVS